MNPELRPSTEEILEDDWLAGEVLTAEELYAEMAARYAQITEAKEREKQAAKARADAM